MTNKPSQADVNDAIAVYRDKTTNPKEKKAIEKNNKKS